MELHELDNIPNIGKNPLHYVFEINIVNTEGLLLEFGVFSGSTINYIASKIKGKRVYGFDSFEGLPEPWMRSDNGWATTHRAFDRQGSLPPVAPNVTLVKGWFNETLPDFLKDNTQPITFVHVDCDIYSSTKCIFDLMKTQLADGCVIVFDELVNYPDFEKHEWKAWWELVNETGITWEWIGKNGTIQKQNIHDRGPADQSVAVRIIRNPAFTC